MVSRKLFKNMISHFLCQSGYIIKHACSKIPPKHNKEKFMPQMLKDIVFQIKRFFQQLWAMWIFFLWLRIQGKTCLSSETIKICIRSVCNINNINPLTRVRACSCRAQLFALCTLKGLQLQRFTESLRGPQCINYQISNAGGSINRRSGVRRVNPRLYHLNFCCVFCDLLCPKLFPNKYPLTI